jgi:NADPH-dependent 2,4-dienoyl-CoA reductase/sulfur reductase-like enzyme
MPNLKWAREVKRTVKVPVGVVGGVLTPQMAEDALAAGDVDIVSLGRELIADPEWVRKAAENRPEDITPCLRCSNCYHIASDHWNVGCSVNPRYHHEAFVPAKIERAEETKRVVVVGAGPGGMKAAISACDRGHKVTLIEREQELGGMLRFIAKEPHKSEVARLLEHYRTQIAKRDIDVRLGCEATPELVKSLAPDALCIAIGATERMPRIEGLEGPHVMAGTEAIAREHELGQHVLILGGGSIGCEIALALAEQGRDVTVVEMCDRVAGNANRLYQEALRQKFELHPNIHVFTSCSCQKVAEGEARCMMADGTARAIPFDDMVVSTGMAARSKEVEALFGIVRNTVAIGDCTKPSSIMNAVFEGHSFALCV